MPFFLRRRGRKCSAGFQPAKVLLTQKELSSLHAGETPALRFFLTSCASAVGSLVAAEGGSFENSSSPCHPGAWEARAATQGRPYNWAGTAAAIFIRSGAPQDHGSAAVKAAPVIPSWPSHACGR